MRYLSQLEAQDIDCLLMGEVGYSIDQLMEVAGLTVAKVVYHQYQDLEKFCFVCGPGNNGGDGLVAARYMKLYKKDVVVFYPKENKTSLFQRLQQQLIACNVDIKHTHPDDFNIYDVVVDCVFGFSFKHPIREPFDSIINAFCTVTRVISVDIPSGWEVDNEENQSNFNPECLISLTAPKLCSKGFRGIHYVGGRFVPNHLVNIEYKHNEDFLLLNSN